MSSQEVKIAWDNPKAFIRGLRPEEEPLELDDVEAARFISGHIDVLFRGEWGAQNQPALKQQLRDRAAEYLWSRFSEERRSKSSLTVGAVDVRFAPDEFEYEYIVPCSIWPRWFKVNSPG
jgi:hypothetical protein